jgi:hypothetical protein
MSRVTTISVGPSNRYPVPTCIVVQPNRKGRLIATARAGRDDDRIRHFLHALFPDRVRGLRWKAGVWTARINPPVVEDEPGGKRAAPPCSLATLPVKTSASARSGAARRRP